MILKTRSLLHLCVIYFTLFVSNSFALSNASDEISVLTDVAYGKEDKQVLDVYYPAGQGLQHLPVILMVHGGAWRIGDKASRAVVKNKVAHWVPKGFIFISVNYPMLPKAHPMQQAASVAKAVAFAQKNAEKWGGSPNKFVLMGHSAGAHLVTLLSTRYRNLKHTSELKPWLGSIALDSAAYDIPKVMNAKSPPRFYKKAFGDSADYWAQASPLHQLSGPLFPFLAVCSSKRTDDACLQAQSFVDQATKYGTRTKLVPVALSHREINVQLGLDACYTKAVDEFMGNLDPLIKSLLTSPPQPAVWRKSPHTCEDY